MIWVTVSSTEIRFNNEIQSILLPSDKIRLYLFEYFSIFLYLFSQNRWYYALIENTSKATLKWTENNTAAFIGIKDTVRALTITQTNTNNLTRISQTDAHIINDNANTEKLIPFFVGQTN